jgi:D-sedoheptulose 7-phosphate isomerase
MRFARDGGAAGLGEIRAIDRAMEDLCDLLCGAAQGSVYIIGNGGSAAVAAHIANDFVNAGKLRAITLHDAPVLTCMANDYGYDNAYARLLRTMARKGDILIAISSGGNSPNILNAVSAADEVGVRTVTLSGFKADNKLRRLGEINVWIPVEDYGLAEIGHLMILHNLADRLREMRTAACVAKDKR